MVDIYNLEAKYNRQFQEVDDWDTTKANKELIKNYLKLRAIKLSPGKKNSTIIALKAIFAGTKKRDKIITKDYDNLTIQDFQNINSKVWSLKLKPETHKFYNLLIKKLFYFKFLDSKDAEKHEIISRLQSRLQDYKLLENQEYSREVTEDECVSIDEALKLLNRATRPIEKALIACAFEGTKRPNEYLTVKIKDVNKTPDGFVLTITPSKGKHKKEDKAKLYIYNLASYFGEFWNSHPYKKDLDAALFYREDFGHEGELLGAAGAKKIIWKLARKSGIKKMLSLYSFRRGGYTWKVKSGMNKATAGRDMGWKPGSSQEQNYLNLTDEDVELERKQLAGKKVVKKSMKEIRDKVCPWCSGVNAPGNDVCSICGKELDLKKVLEKERASFEDRLRETEKQMAFLMAKEKELRIADAIRKK